MTDCRSQIGLGYIWQQDGAPSHTARSTQTYLEAHTEVFINKNQWPPNSPDLNPMDYGIWAAMDEKLRKLQSNNLQDLQRNITNVWRRLSQRFIGSVVRQFPGRLQKVIDNNGSCIEHAL